MVKRAKLVLLMILPLLISLAILEPIYLTLLKHGAQERLVKLRERAEDGIRGRLKAELDLLVQEANLERGQQSNFNLAAKHLKELASELPEGDQLVVIAESPGQPNVQTVLLSSAFPEYEGQPASIDPGQRLPKVFVDDMVVEREMAAIGKPETLSPFDRLVATAQEGSGEVRLFWPKPPGQNTAPDTAYPVLALAQRVPSQGWVVAAGAYTDWIDPMVAHEGKKYRSMVSKFLQWMAGTFAILLILAVGASGPALRNITQEPTLT